MSQRWVWCWAPTVVRFEVDKSWPDTEAWAETYQEGVWNFRSGNISSLIKIIIKLEIQQYTNSYSYLRLIS